MRSSVHGPPIGGDRDRATRTALRADAARNIAQIRSAAIGAFRGRGLSTPLEEIATAAGVSKATIYNRFGGREGLIDAVIGELVATRLHAIMQAARRVVNPWAAIAGYITDRRDLQFREPAFTDALPMTYPKSAELVALAGAATETTANLFQQMSPTDWHSARCPHPRARTTTAVPASSSTASAPADRKAPGGAEVATSLPAAPGWRTVA